MRPRLAALVILLGSNSLYAGSATDKTSDLTFEKHIRPILKAHCFHCHGEEKTAGGLDLRLRHLMAAGGEAGPAIVPGNAADSYLYQRLTAGEMPPDDVAIRPTQEDIETIARWINTGAKTARPEPDDPEDLPKITEEEREHWAFQPIRRPPVPQVQQADQVRTPIDAFLLQQLEQHGLSFAPQADRRTLIRRATFDLHGLPPTPEEVERFLADEAAGAYERMIDRLLASPRYGERWGRHWLDVAGYADSEGYNEADTERPYAWKYRDYVIRSLNADKPFDQFIQEQLAGDEMVELPYENLTPDEVEKLIATGFLRMAPDGTGTRNDDPELAKNDVIAETVKIVSSSLLGMTVGCAQCHDHRFDPILHVDYHRMRAIFEPAYDWKNWRNPRQRLVSLITDEDRQRKKAVEQEIAEADAERKAFERECIEMVFERELEKIPEELRALARETFNTPAAKRVAEQKKLFADYPNLEVRGGGPLKLYLEIFPEGREKKAELIKLEQRIAEIRKKMPPEDFVRALTEVPEKVPTTYVFHRGDREQPTDAVGPGDLTVLYSDEGSALLPPDNPELPTTGRRLAYARRLTDGTHPLTARALVNRFWLHHFGRGLVATPGDFGTQGELATHPELLDWLASEFMESGWQLKPFHWLIMTSTAYRQSSHREPAKGQLDPDNRLYGRMPVRRLEAEAVRDAILAVTGELEQGMHGPPVPVQLTDDGQVLVANEKGPSRRSLYVQVRRSLPLDMLDAFDAPAMEPNCEIRNASTVAPQALLLMNNAVVLERAQSFADRVRNDAGDEEAQVRRAWQLAFAAEPTVEELKASLDFLTQQSEQFARRKTDKLDPEQQALASFCQVLLGSNQFLYVD